jgi:hypothetical protein
LEDLLRANDGADLQTLDERCSEGAVIMESRFAYQKKASGDLLD